ncbi:MAG: DEAD/DEAH box helicase [Methanobrevibacter sp.]|uniref:DEAD/DEAH box helicase n=1 Tax=Methanobrevibacter sp. TaxID=66852 RepID=UPI0026DF7756|nr:DEAD/DEAH box helicase [Methanobrevibacter sp.]MDO5848701.1 DEAD/DEAH box helicase [Methanobrevibacter sp.]
MSLTTFNNFDIDNNIKKAIRNMGFEEPTPIQELTIPEAVKGKDIIGQAQTGSGKTLAYGIPILQKIFIKDKSPQAIIICPTRELSIQVANEISRLGSNIKNLKVLPVYGGQPIGRQIRVLNKGVHIVIGTPGRILDHIERGTLDLIGIETVVLDEADEMLDMGFREDIEQILRHTPKQRQTLLFSATIPDDIKRIAKFYQRDPKHLKIDSKQMTVPEISEFYYNLKDRDKLDGLTRLIDVYDINLGLVFCNTKKRVDYVVRHLKSRGYSVDGIHGDMKQKIRDKVMNKFRNGNIEILVATDVAARGIDVPNVQAVFNYDVPQNPEYYVHRIGRTARAGNVGYAFTFVNGKEHHMLNNIRNVTKSSIKKQQIPSYKEMEEIRNGLIFDEVKNIIEKDDLKNYTKAVKKYTRKNYTTLEVAAALLKMVKDD